MGDSNFIAKLRRFCAWITPVTRRISRCQDWIIDAWHYPEAARQFRTRPLEFLEVKYRFAIRRFHPNYGMTGPEEEHYLRSCIMGRFEGMKPTADATRH